MSITHANFLTQVRNYTEVSSTILSDTVINRFVINAENRIFKTVDSDDKKFYATSETTSGNRYITVPSGTRIIRYIQVTDPTTSDQVYLNFSNYIDTLCIPDGCYDFNMYDSYGDGWQGGSYNLIDSINNVISSGGLQGAYYFGFHSFSVNQGNQCPVTGCTEINSHNYNPLATIDDGSCQVISDNVELLYNWQGDSLPVSSIGGQYTEVYGFVYDNKEYAVIGTTLGTHIIDVTNPFNSQEVSYIAGANQGNIIHRDYHVLDNYLYAVCDQGPSTLQIIDFSYLPDSTSLVYDSDQLINTMHNIFIDTLHRKLYTTGGPVYDLTDPVNPIFLFDEIGSHLDKQNRQILLDMINRFEIQFFLTGTDKNLFSFVSTNAQFYNITNI